MRLVLLLLVKTALPDAEANVSILPCTSWEGAAVAAASAGDAVARC